MAGAIVIRDTFDFARSVTIKSLPPILVEGDDNAHRIEITCNDGGVLADLSEYSCVGFVANSNRQAYPLAGEIYGSVATVLLDAYAYMVSGPIAIFIKLSKPGFTTTIYKGKTTVETGVSDVLFDPNDLVTSLPEMMALISTVENMTVDAYGLVSSADPVATISEYDGAKHILFGIPKGERGDSGNEGAHEATAGISLGAELMDSSGWTSTGWTGDFETGFVHTVGQSTPLRRTMPPTGQKLYLIEFDIASTVDTGSPDASRSFTVTIGNSERIRLYRDTGNQHFKIGLQSTEDGELVFQPCNVASLADSGEFVGTISNISVKEITGISETNLAITDINNDTTVQYRQTPAAQFNTFYGRDAGRACIGGDGNSGYGFEALAQITSGFWNTCFGYRAGYQLRHGSRNIAIGTYALKDSRVATRCIAIGTFAQEKNIDGYNNISIGSDALQYATTGNNKIAIGVAALGSDNGDGGIAIGYNAAGVTTNFDFGIAIGAFAAPAVNGYANIALGHYAMKNKTSGDENVSIGVGTMQNNLGGIRNVAIGGWAGEGPAGGSNYSYCVIIGRGAGNVNEGNDNVFLGFGAGVSNTTAAANVLIGKYAGSNLTTGGGNVIIGNGQQAEATDSYDTLNLAGYVFGRTASSKYMVGIGVHSPTAALHLPGSDGAAYTAPLRFTAGTLLTNPANGAMEYDGTHLYYTDDSNVRHQLAVVA